MPSSPRQFVVHGHRFRLVLRGGDRELYLTRYAAGGWHESRVSRNFVALCHGSSLVLDIGAHIGWYTCLAAAAAPNARIVAFELNPANARLTRLNAALNAPGRVQVVEAAVSDRHGRTTHSTRGRSTMEWALRKRPAHGSRQARTVTIDEWCLRHKARPDFVKIDVEGHEAQVLRGMNETLRNMTPRLLIEVHSLEAQAECMRLLRSRRYIATVVAPRASDRHWRHQFLLASPSRIV